jgi:hypothetical protein
MKESKHLNKWKVFHVHGKELNIVMMSCLSKLVSRFSVIPNKIPASYFVGMNKIILKFIQKDKRCRRVNMILRNKSKVGELTLFD